MVIHQRYIVWKCIRVKDMCGDPLETEVSGDPSEKDICDVVQERQKCGQKMCGNPSYFHRCAIYKRYRDVWRSVRVTTMCGDLSE